MRKYLLIVPILCLIATIWIANLTAHTNAEKTVDDLSPITMPIKLADQPEAIARKPVVAMAEQSVATAVSIVVEVASGDTLSSIADAHQTTYQRLFDANPEVASPNTINPTQKIRIPLPGEVLIVRELPIPAQSQPMINRSVATVSSAPAVADGSVWDMLAKCESGGNWSINTGNGYYGGLQFSLSTWRAVGGSGLPSENSREEQIVRAEMLLARSGWGQWPACTSKLGLR